MREGADELMREQQEYYELWAPEYDAIMESGGSHRPRPGAPPSPEVNALIGLGDLGDCLEIAAGSGWWTWLLAEHALSVSALDASDSMLERNRARTSPCGNVRYVLADVFDWSPDRTYDSVCFAYWLSHVPAGHCDRFWDVVRRSLRPGGSLFFVDEAYEDPGRRWHRRIDAEVTVRRLGEREFRVVKVYRDPDELAVFLRRQGFAVDVRVVAGRSLVGVGRLIGGEDTAA